MAAADAEFPVEPKKSVPTIASSNNRGARRSLAKDLRDNLPSEAYSPRLFTKKQLMLLQQQRHYQFLEEQKHQQAVNVLNSRRVYPSCSSVSSSCSSSRPHQIQHQQPHFLMRNTDFCSSTECSNHGSPLVPSNPPSRKVPKKMVVDEKQLAMKLLRARNAAAMAACSSSSTSTSSSSSENASLRASSDSLDFPLHRPCPIELARRSFVAGCIARRNSNSIHTLMRQKSISSSSAYSIVAESSNDLAGKQQPEEKQTLIATTTGTSGRSSDAEDSIRMIRSGGMVVEKREAIKMAMAPVLLRSASCSSAASSASSSLLINKLVRLKAADMAVGMQEHAFYCANQVLDAMDKLQCKRVAWALKKEFDKAYGPAWHCIVGTSFGSYVTHSVGGFLYFSIGKVSVLLFQTAVELIEHH